LSPATTSIEQAGQWLSMTGPNMDGVVAKRIDYEYRSGDRTEMPERSCPLPVVIVTVPEFFQL
jgi:hypothetical protein